MNSKAEQVDVLVIGAGIIGATLANELQRSGRQVLMIDRSEAGLGCSYGNAGWVTPCFAMPLPQPGMLLKSMGWMMNPEGPLYIKPEISFLLIRWMTRFLLCMNEKKMRSSIAVLTDISKYSLNAYKTLSQKSPGSMDFKQNGLLMVSGTDQGMAGIQKEIKLMAEHGIPGSLLNAQEALNMEASLKPVIQGGVYFPTEASVEPLEAVRAYVKEFEAAGGRFQTKTEVYDFVTNGDQIEEVITTRGRFRPKLIVLATGPWSPRVAKTLGVNIPLLGGKGYSLIVNEFEVKPKHPMMIVDRKIAVTPRENSVRLAGTMELVNGDESITSRRVKAILKGSAHYLKLSPEPKIQEVWRGLRPCTPDGVPMLGFSKKWGNLFYSLGHQMLGLQSAPGSARFCTDLITGKTPYTNPEPFSPIRFE
jgi:D-amino-acid dehydrogenase